jgi:photosystem II stability/assembly factor-like uncharacterized protein
MPTPFGYDALGTTVRQGPSGTWVAVGYYNYVGRSNDGITFTTLTSDDGSHVGALAAEYQWYNDVMPGPDGRWWIVGEKGAILVSTDDGATWLKGASPSLEDLYGVNFAPDGQHGMTVGAHGTALVSTDGGRTWSDRSTGLDEFLGGVAWPDATTALVIGERGTVLTTVVP